MSEEQLANLQLFSENVRIKRGLVKAVGKINKWLFGTLDSDVEVKFDKYLSTLLENQQLLSDEIKNSL